MAESKKPRESETREMSERIKPVDTSKYAANPRT